MVAGVVVTVHTLFVVVDVHDLRRFAVVAVGGGQLVRPQLAVGNFVVWWRSCRAEEPMRYDWMQNSGLLAPRRVTGDDSGRSRFVGIWAVLRLEPQTFS